ncbi:16S rRNA (uracil(1498)-N(3))-methyltransferase [Phreatobacter cathodiphilus]|uniref:Ribosomal RNA small subunit methyltransferase E n=1 Tax=Phreatobacter cathodiphilus TaxID=1868589 RepID=A0A2S0N6I5_9HYPH|nr:16S rRNA (uracil(1498)-N(3))-methyltransferase [Phreatobacter cathodiphilus]AVO43627.1 16S rRNA (uracil(1498)-N(3))-methyltransferase [Phreatobacter cathodiphilus]
MAAYDFKAIRLFVAAPLAEGAIIACGADQANYLLNVMRLDDGARIAVFDGASGEWAARLRRSGKRSLSLAVEERLRPQPEAGDLRLLFAPLKHARLDYMVQKAVEMGVSRLVPVITRRTQASRVNSERMRANAVEAAEQCGILAVAGCDDAQPLTTALAALPDDVLLVFCDESAAIANPVEALRAAGPAEGGLAVLIGPEGGFSEEERVLIARRPRTLALSLGPRILRADTAAVAALAVVQASLGDWR